MGNELITVEDLRQFKLELLKEVKVLLIKTPSPIPRPWLKSYEVQRMLKISAGTLQHLRDSGRLKCSKVGGIIFYEMKEIEEMIKCGHHRNSG